MKARRRALGASEKSAADASICKRLSARCDAGALLSAYLAGGDEINIDPFIESILRKGGEVAVPRWNGEMYDLARLKGLGGNALRMGPMGIREPIDAEIVSPENVQVWIVPGLAFTKDGKRLGYGGGWYDRFLFSAPVDAVKIGVAYSFQIVGDLPTEPHDILLTDLCIAHIPDIGD